MPKISTQTLVSIAAFGGMVVAGTGFYFRHKIRKEVKELPCYTEGMKVLREHDGAKKVLGEPIRDFNFELDDKTSNYWGSDKAAFSIPVRGSHAAGQYQFWAQKDPEGWNVTKAHLRIASYQDKLLSIKKEE